MVKVASILFLILIALSHKVEFARTNNNCDDSFIHVYASRVERLTWKEIETVAESTKAKIKLIEGTQENWERVEFKWDDETIVLFGSKFDSEAEQAEHLDGFSGFMITVLANREMDAKVFAIHRQIQRSKHLYGFEVSDDLGEKPYKAISQIAKTTLGVVFLNPAIVDAEMNLLIGPDREMSPEATIPLEPTSKPRRDRTNQVLKQQEIEVPDHLPSIDGDSQVGLRDAEEVAKRALCLLAVARHADGDREFKAMEFLKEQGVEDALTTAEREFLNARRPSREDRAAMTWRYEALTALLWALGHRDTLEFPDSQADAAKMIELVMSRLDGFVKRAKLRPVTEILDATDLYYCSFWFAQDHRVNDKQQSKVALSVVYERLYALNWLIRYMNKSWDEVQVDS